jgi:hypothetical protein
MFEVPAPVLFNCLKHHLSYIKSILVTHSQLPLDPPAIARLLLPIGTSQMDLYTGSLSPSEISRQIIQSLQTRDVLEKSLFHSYTARQEQGFFTLAISDASLWVVRIGEQPDRYVHIHPGRHSPHTIRVKAGALKTAIAVAIWTRVHQEATVDLTLVNHVRRTILGESPVKAVHDNEGMGKIIQLLSR